MFFRDQKKIDSQRNLAKQKNEFISMNPAKIIYETDESPKNIGN